MFAVKRFTSNHSVCPITAMEVYVDMCEILNVSIHHGYFFRPLDPSGDIRQAPLTSSATNVAHTQPNEPVPAAQHDSVHMGLPFMVYAPGVRYP